MRMVRPLAKSRFHWVSKVVLPISLGVVTCGVNAAFAADAERRETAETSPCAQVELTELSASWDRYDEAFAAVDEGVAEAEAMLGILAHTDDVAWRQLHVLAISIHRSIDAPQSSSIGIGTSLPCIERSKHLRAFRTVLVSAQQIAERARRSISNREPVKALVVSLVETLKTARAELEAVGREVSVEPFTVGLSKQKQGMPARELATCGTTADLDQARALVFVAQSHLISTRAHFTALSRMATRSSAVDWEAAGNYLDTIRTQVQAVPYSLRAIDEILSCNKVYALPLAQVSYAARNLSLQIDQAAERVEQQRSFSSKLRPMKDRLTYAERALAALTSRLGIPSLR